MATKQKRRLIVFDVEGVLIPRNRFFFEVVKNQGLLKTIKILLLGILYESGILKLDSALKRIFNVLAGTDTETLTRVFTKIPATPQLKSFFEQLKLRKYTIVMISSGIPTFLVKKLGDSIGADYSYGIDVGLNDGRLTGEISGDAIGINGKLKILNKVLEAEGLTHSNCIVVADDRNNRCLFLPETLKIAFNPDFILRVKADYVMSGKLSSILPAVDGQTIKRSFPSRNDLVREDIHAAGCFVPVIAHLIGVPIMALLICITSLVYTVSELSRLEGRNLPLISSITRHAASQSELFGFAAAPLYFALGILLTLLLFPAPISGAAIAVFALGDSAASIFGGLLGKRLPFNKGKTVEGTLAGFLFAF